MEVSSAGLVPQGSPDTTTYVALSALGIYVHDYQPKPFTKDMMSFVVVAMDEPTRNKIQAEFEKLVPLFSEVAHMETASIQRRTTNSTVLDTNNVVATVNHIYDAMDEFVKNIKHYH